MSDVDIIVNKNVFSVSLNKLIILIIITIIMIIIITESKQTMLKKMYLLICFCRFDLSCLILGNDNFIKNVYLVLSGLIK